jgi:hypothetical protein
VSAQDFRDLGVTSIGDIPEIRKACRKGRDVRINFIFILNLKINFIKIPITRPTTALAQAKRYKSSRVLGQPITTHKISVLIVPDPDIVSL